MAKRYSKALKGAIAKTVVVKQYADKTVITAYPDMTHLQPSEKQKAARSAFARAVIYAQQINNDPLQKKMFAAKITGKRSVYHAALSEYLNIVHPPV